ncbi:MAG: nuclear transport factor 2 family protein [Sphingobacteriales bacterium]|nr:MAG: nuclear transport factor 2 family protein [Sphingobacteriales bacterium]
MTTDIDKRVGDFLAAANTFDTIMFMAQWHKDAVLDDPCVGRKFAGHNEIQEYFEDYFIGYNTQTQLVKLDATSKNKVRIEVLFTGTFPQGEIGGTFDLVYREGKIQSAKAELI